MKVLIADDEHLICEWLDFCIRQIDDCEVVGIAHDGRQAMDLYRQTEPDLILTDIKMPVMTGIELLQAIREHDRTTHIALLTAYSDFELAREALHLGANKYMLKTEIQSESLREYVKMVHREICSAKPGEADKATEGQSQSVIRSILTGKQILTDKDLFMLKERGVRWRNNGIFAFAVWKSWFLQNGLQYPNDSAVRHVAGFDYNDLMYMVVGNIANDVSQLDKERHLAEYIKQIQQINLCTVGVSVYVDHLKDIPTVTTQAESALSESFYTQKLQRFQCNLKYATMVEKVNRHNKQIELFRMKIQQNTGGMRKTALKELLDYIGENRPSQLEQILRILTDIVYMTAAQTSEELDESMSKEKIYNRFKQCPNYSQVCEMLWSYPVFKTEDVYEKPLSKAVELAVRYIQQHYSDPLGVEQVADTVFLHPDYFSRIFKEETGSSFVSYLTDVRMQQAALLLTTTAQRVQSIAKAVGYNNVSYFSTSFRKKFGVNPYEYRQHGD